MASEKFRDFNLSQSILTHQRVHDPGFLDLARPASRAVQAINGRLRASFIGFDPPRRKMMERSQLARRAEPFKSVNPLGASFLNAHHDRGDLSIVLQRPHHDALGFRDMETITGVELADLVQRQFLRILSNSVQHAGSPCPSISKKRRVTRGIAAIEDAEPARTEIA